MRNIYKNEKKVNKFMQKTYTLSRSAKTP